jgi:hypothetical protein
MSGGSGGALVLLLIVRNFQLGFLNGKTAKFATMTVFLFGEYARLLGAGSKPSLRACYRQKSNTR